MNPSHHLNIFSGAPKIYLLSAALLLSLALPAYAAEAPADPGLAEITELGMHPNCSGVRHKNAHDQVCAKIAPLRRSL
jgi:hypothetical protein